MKQFGLEVWGDFACFSRPELKVERYTYPVITPSAARAIFDAIYLNFDGGTPNRPTFRWQVRRIEVVEPVHYIALSQNEVKGKIHTDKVALWMTHSEQIEPLIADARGKGTEEYGRTQRQTIGLRRVRYRLFAEAVLYEENHTLRQLIEKIFARRARAGQCYHQPCLGQREFGAYFELVETQSGRCAAVNEDIGWMVYDVFDLSRPGSSSDPWSISTFRAHVRDGVLEVPPYSSEDVHKSGLAQSLRERGSPQVGSGATGMFEALVEYARRTGLATEPGFSEKVVRWIANVNLDGVITSVAPADPLKGRAVVFACCPDLQLPAIKALPAALGRMENGIAVKQGAHFLADTCSTVGLFPNGLDSNHKILDKHRVFTHLIERASWIIPELRPIHSALSEASFLVQIHAMLIGCGAKPTDRLSFSVDGVPVPDMNVWHSWWRAFREEASPRKLERNMVCLATGERVVPARTHPRLTSLGVGASSVGASLIASGKEAFSSSSFRQGENSALSEDAASAYTSALDHLLRRAPVIDGTKVVHWYSTDTSTSLDPLALLFQPSEVRELENFSSRTSLTSSEIRAFADWPGLPNAQYHVMVVRGAKARARVRFFASGTQEQAVAAVSAWFADLEVCTISGDGSTSATPAKLLASIKKPIDNDNAEGNRNKTLHSLHVRLWQTALDPAVPVPISVANDILTTLYRSLANRDFQKAVAYTPATWNSTLRDTLHACMGGLKGYLVRAGDHDITVNLNPNHPSANYQSGRLAALLHRIEEIANSNPSSNSHQVFAASIAGLIERLDRQTRTVKRSLDWIAAARPWLALALESYLERIWESLGSAVPRNNSPKARSLFILGYYQQLAFNNSKRTANPAAEFDLEDGDDTNEEMDDLFETIADQSGMSVQSDDNKERHE